MEYATDAFAMLLKIGSHVVVYWCALVVVRSKSVVATTFGGMSNHGAADDLVTCWSIPRSLDLKYFNPSFVYGGDHRTVKRADWRTLRVAPWTFASSRLSQSPRRHPSRSERRLGSFPPK